MGKEFPIHLGQAAEIAEEGDKLRVTAGEQRAGGPGPVQHRPGPERREPRLGESGRDLGRPRHPGVRPQQHAGGRPSDLHRRRRERRAPNPPRGRRRGQDRRLQRGPRRDLLLPPQGPAVHQLLRPQHLRRRCTLERSRSGDHRRGPDQLRARGPRPDHGQEPGRAASLRR